MGSAAASSSRSERRVRGAVARLALVLTLALAHALALAAAARVSPRPAQTPERLELGRTLMRETAGTEAHAYLIACAPRQFVHAVVVQNGVDVVVTLSATGGQRVLEVDSPNGPNATATRGTGTHTSGLPSS